MAPRTEQQRERCKR